MNKFKTYLRFLDSIAVYQKLRLGPTRVATYDRSTHVAESAYAHKCQERSAISHYFELR